MTPYTSKQIRRQYIEFFEKKHGHTFVPSSPVVPHDDPTLLFTNAGMNQFKPIFLGQEKRNYTRAVNTQKCIRAGGKHNDLDDVGRSRRHHTFFEMLGNWSFGDYFKRGAIEMAWELLTQVWKLDPGRLHVSCFEGDEKNGVPRDIEAATIWKEVANLPDDHIHYFGKDNFWEMGDTGPCGPCTEIYYDRTPDKSGAKYVNGDDPRVMEIWNNVFIQYNRNADRSLTTLPSQHVDTGMGFERICQVLQDKQDNYGIDLWEPFFDALTKLSGITYAGKYPATNAADPVAEAADAQLRHDIAFRVIADHVRCLTFALTDGAVPSNEGRGYVLRRILRRAVRFGRQQLELKEPFLHTLVPEVVEAMGDAFPELKTSPGHVAEIIRGEELSFGKTLDRGLQLFGSAAADAFHQSLSIEQRGKPMRERLYCSVGSSGTGGSEAEVDAEIAAWREEGILPYYDASTVAVFQYDGSRIDTLDRTSLTLLDARFIRTFVTGTPTISGHAAFKLHDTYGFPIDLTRIMAEERGLKVDIQGYEKLMEQAKELARSGGKEGKSTTGDLSPDAIAQLQQSGATPTDDDAKFTDAPIQAKVLAIWNGSSFGSPVEASDDHELAVILDRTNFYAEMGGQVGDSGTLTAPTSLDLGSIGRADRSVFDVESTKAVGGYVLHVGRLRSGMLAVGETVVATVAEGRNATQKNHTSTHVANWALRETLGEGVQQKGSLVDPERLRFDFSHGKALTDDDLAKVEMLVNQSILKRIPVYAENAPQEQALKINGLRAVFGEKYPPMVRVVSVGVPVNELLADPANDKWRQYSIEFCGGTHLKRTDEAERFVIVAEEAVSKGIRRLVALTGKSALSTSVAGSDVDRLIETAKATSDADLAPAIAGIQKSLAGTIPLRTKRRAQLAVGELQDRLKKFEKSAKSDASKVDVSGLATDLFATATDLGGGKLVVGEAPGVSPDGLLALVNSLRKQSPSIAILLGSADDSKVNFIAAVSDDLIAKGLKAGEWIRDVAKAAGGGGGGRPQLAQAGGKDPAKLNDALAVARAFAASVVE